MDDVSANGIGNDILAKSTNPLRERASTAPNQEFNSQLEVLCQPLHLFFCGGGGGRDTGGLPADPRAYDDGAASFGVSGGRLDGSNRSGGGAAGESGAPHKSSSGGAGGRARGAGKKGSSGGNGSGGGGVGRSGEGEPRSFGSGRIGGGGGGGGWGGGVGVGAKSGARAHWYEVRRFLEVGSRSGSGARKIAL